MTDPRRLGLLASVGLAMTTSVIVCRPTEVAADGHYDVHLPRRKRLRQFPLERLSTANASHPPAGKAPSL